MSSLLIIYTEVCQIGRIGCLFDQFKSTFLCSRHGHCRGLCWSIILMKNTFCQLSMQKSQFPTDNPQEAILCIPENGGIHPAFRHQHVCFLKRQRTWMFPLLWLLLVSWSDEPLSCPWSQITRGNWELLLKWHFPSALSRVLQVQVTLIPVS